MDNISIRRNISRSLYGLSSRAIKLTRRNCSKDRMRVLLWRFWNFENLGVDFLKGIGGDVYCCVHHQHWRKSFGTIFHHLFAYLDIYCLFVFSSLQLLLYGFLITIK